MGLRSSPYNATQGMAWAEEVITGDRNDPENPFRWDYVDENLPGHHEYDTTKPRVSKRRKDGTIAGDVFIYIDDLRPVNDTEKSC
eukprot:scaffold48596_cov51-Attheya_sp.AAC.1